MWKIWYSIFDPRRALIAQAIFLGALMFTATCCEDVARHL